MSAFENNLIFRAARSVRQGFTAFFKHDLTLNRAEEGVRIVLKERPAAAAQRPPTRQEQAQSRERMELELMRVQLAELLNELPDTRQAMRHLVFVEQALLKKGTRALHKLPLDVLQRALEQLEGLVTNWSPVGLASLRSKIAVCVIDREHMDPMATEADAYRTAAVIDHGPTTSGAPLEIEERSDEEALTAAYAALGNMATDSQIEMQGDLSSAASREIERQAMRPLSRASAVPANISLRELQN